jgi:antitoxin CcdA
MSARTPIHDTKASKQTVSLTLNSDLYARAKRLGINTSQVAEAALAEEVARRTAEQMRQEIKDDLDACNAYATKHGSFADLVRDHYSDSEE